jgi:hypothetical protein
MRGHAEDGRHVGYLRRPAEWQPFAPELFDGLAAVVAGERQRVQALQDPGSCRAPSSAIRSSHPAALPPKRTGRVAWFRRVQERVAGCSLVFPYPDNGLETAGYSPGAVVGGKCVALAKVKALAKPGRTFVIYHRQTCPKRPRRGTFVLGGAAAWSRLRHRRRNKVPPLLRSWVLRPRRFAVGPRARTDASLVRPGTSPGTRTYKRLCGAEGVVLRISQEVPPFAASLRFKLSTSTAPTAEEPACGEFQHRRNDNGRCRPIATRPLWGIRQGQADMQRTRADLLGRPLTDLERTASPIVGGSLRGIRSR